ncbi:MAG: hypothetical protein J5I47_00395 [Vicingus serpentipes]|nr:hypothetical protein [Vicingus serpentipes]
MKRYFFIFLTCYSFIAKAQFFIPQEEIQDSAFTIPMITVSYARQWTSADLANRFGFNNNIGGSFAIKTKKQWYFGFKGNFIWGGNVKQDEILNDITTKKYILDDNGKFIDQEILAISDDGSVVEIFLDERGSSFFFIAGKLFNVISPNKNSGILAYGGVGTLHHKISIKYRGNVPALQDELKEGYDRLSFGYAVNGFVGYLFMSKNRLLNFYGGFDYTQGWTKNMRKYNYDTQSFDNKTNTDILYGVRLGWIIRLNKRKAQEFYYN